MLYIDLYRQNALSTGTAGNILSRLAGLFEHVQSPAFRARGGDGGREREQESKGEGDRERGREEKGREGRAANLRRHIETQVDTNKDGESRDRSQ